MKNYVKIFQTHDINYLNKLKLETQRMQENATYPLSFEMPITIQFELTSKCNLKCLHCYNRSGENFINTTMTTESWLKLSKQIVKYGGIFQCILSGGEPFLLGEDLLKIMDILHSDGTSFVIISNGYYINDLWIKKLKKYRFYWMQISIDGSNETLHDNFRGVKGSWKKALDASLKISNAGFPLVIAHTVTPDNIDKLSDMAELAYYLGATSLIVGESLPSGRAYKNVEILLNENQKNYMYDQLTKLQELYGSKLEIQRSGSAKNQLMRYKIGPNIGLIVRPNGDMRLDCMAPFIIGNVLKDDFKKIWDEKGKVCWENPEINKLIDSIDELTNKSSYLTNYIDHDIIL